jgi:uncharacterized protein (TIGR02246 family)
MAAPRWLVLILCLVTTLFATGCQLCSTRSAAAREADVKALRAADAAWCQAYTTRDLDKALSFYADDAVMLAPNAPAVTGRESFRAGIRKFLADPNFAIHWEATRVEVAQSGDLGYTQGTLTYTMTDPGTSKPFSDKAKYLAVWKKQADGNWRAVEDTYNTDLPPAPPAK